MGTPPFETNERNFAAEFLRHVLTGNVPISQTFEIIHVWDEERGLARLHQYVQTPVGTGKFVYESCLSANRGDPIEVLRYNSAKTFHLAAVVTEGTVYFLNTTGPLGHIQEKVLEELSSEFQRKIIKFQDWYKGFAGNYLTNTIVPFYEGLVELPKLNWDQSDDCVRKAREIIVYGVEKNAPKDIVLGNFPTRVHDGYSFRIPCSAAAAMTLCGLTTGVEEETHRGLHKQKRDIEVNKAMQKRIKDLVSAGCSYKDWEIRLLSSIRNLKEKARLSVTFCVNGKELTGKITRVKIQDKMISGSHAFFYDDFFSHDEGRELCNSVGSFGSGLHSCNLRIEDIVKVTYGNRTIFERCKEEN